MTAVLMVTGLVAGGVGRHVEQMTCGLTEAGHRVVVACPAIVAQRFELGRAGAEVVEADIGARPVPHRDRAVIARLRAAMGSVDVVHAHGLRAGALAVAARGRPRSDGRAYPVLVVTHHNAAPQGRLAAMMHGGLERVVARGADLVLAVSPDLQARCRELGHPRVELAVVPAGYRQGPADPHGARDGLGLDPGAVLLAAVGRLSPQKGLDRLLDAVALVADRLPEVVTVIAGEGPQQQALQRRIDRERLPVRLLGHRDDVPDLLGAADLVVSAARWEGQPVWLQEALLAGVPIVATDVGGTSAVLDGAGELVPDVAPSQVAQALADRIVYVLTEPGRRSELADLARERAGRLPTREDAVRTLLAAYGRAASLHP